MVSPYSKFCENLFSISEKVMPIKNFSICDIILSPDIPFSVEDFEGNQEFEEELSSLCDQFKAELLKKSEGNLNNNHPAHKTFSKIESLCKNYKKDKTDCTKSTNYLGKLYNYLKAFSKVLFIEENTSIIISKGMNTSLFELLDYNRSELMGQLLFEKNLDPTEFEAYFYKLKLDFLYHLIGNCFPTINLHTEEFVTEEELFPENNLYVPTANIIQYIMKRNWLLALILKEMYKVPNIKMDINESRIQAFSNYKDLPSTQNLRCIFDNNEIITSLQHEIPIQKVKIYMDQKMLVHNNMFSSQISTHSNQSLETAEEIIEDSLKTTDWKELFDVLNSIPEVQMRKSKELRDLKDSVACSIISDHFEFECFKYVRHIEDKTKRLDAIWNNFMSWPADFCLDIINAELSNFETSENCTEQLENWRKTIELCKGLSKLLNVTSWSRSRAIVQEDIEGSFKKLVATYEIDQILLFIDINKPSEEILRIINEECFMNALLKGCQSSNCTSYSIIYPMIIPYISAINY
ncbi:hypothetical protein HHI36_001591 [Cryptolaemus montrouzieri]|uniref:Uncharacterized protein n=1 Tax=Cryptolaemus montrouzieri TaxID=559131 RepID=A0ABD2P8D8_9CUCU